MSWAEFACSIFGILLAATLWGIVKGVSIFSKVGGNTSFGIICFQIGCSLTAMGLIYYFAGLFVRRIHVGRSFNTFLETFSVTFALFDVVLQLYNKQIPV